jgi:hypothetical protein
LNILNESFGSLTRIKTGDLVCWSKFSQDFTGVVSSLIYQNDGGRKVVFAIIFCFETQQSATVLALNLKKISKNDEEVIEN